MTYPKSPNKHLYDALFNPMDFIKYKKFKKKLPKKYIIIYRPKLLGYIKRKYHPKKLKNNFLSVNFYIYKNIGFIQLGGIGSPYAVTILEELIALGGKEFINIGIAGGLQQEGTFLCNKALRDEGTSYHYIPQGDFSYPNEQLTNKLEKIMKNNKINFLRGSVWTIDAPYRETKLEINKYKKQGIATVDMEASALFAVAKYRKVKIASAFVVSDVLGEKWEPKFHHINIQKSLNKLIDSSVECLA